MMWNPLRVISRLIARCTLPYAVRTELKVIKGVENIDKLARKIWMKHGKTYKGYGITFEDVRRIIYKTKGG